MTSNDSQADQVAAVRAKMLDDLAPLDVYAKAWGRSVRTAQRMKARGEIVTTRIGGADYVVLSATRERMLSRSSAGRTGKAA